MNHNDAVQLKAAEKYVLGELSHSQREEYEEHYFDCGECALDIRAIAAFADTARVVLRQEEESAKQKAGERAGWFAWLRPAFAVPAMAALLLVVAYQDFVSLPKARQAAEHGTAQVFAAPFSLQRAGVRGGEAEETKIQIHANENLPLKFDFTPRQAFSEYVCQLQDQAGHSLYRVKVPGTFVNQEVHLVIPAGGLKTGKYALVFTAASPASVGNPQPSGEEVLRLGFSVEILP